jgi:hypothetical protein
VEPYFIRREEIRELAQVDLQFVLSLSLSLSLPPPFSLSLRPSSCEESEGSEYLTMLASRIVTRKCFLFRLL